ncbi:MAG: hypothetical protein ACXWD7_03895 [Solirubrobacterales bacterium]
MWIGRSEITRRELGLVVAAACLLAVVMHWPLVLHLGTDIPRDVGDPLVQSWQEAWGGYALIHQPLHFFQGNMFWPQPDSLAFSDGLIGYAPISFFGSGVKAAVVRYDLLFLFAYALSFIGAYLLARELGLRPAGAAIAGAAFAFAPYRLEQDGHMQVVSNGGVPLAFALALRGYRLRSPGWVIAGWAVAAWQLTIGFTLGLPMAHLIGLLGIIPAVVWWRRGRPPLPRRLVVATLAGVLIYSGTAIMIGRPYLRVAEDHPQAHRKPDIVEGFSGPLKVFLLPPEENEVWGAVSAPLRDGLIAAPEKTLFPGLAILVLAVVGLCSDALPRRLRIGLGLGVLGVSILMMGFQVKDGYLWPYRILFEANPLWEAIRVPGRLIVFSSLGLALLAGAGAQAVARRLAAMDRVPGALRGRAPATLVAVLFAVILVEGRGVPFDPFDKQAQPPVPLPPARTADIPAPQLHLPALRPEDNRRYLLWSTDGFPLIVNGRSSLVPTFTGELIEAMQPFPDPYTVRVLRRLGVRSVILHTDRVAGTPWAGAAAKPVAGLPLRRRQRPGGLVIYEIRSPRAGAPTTIPESIGALRRSR